MSDPLDELQATSEDIRRSQIFKLEQTEMRIRKLLTDGLPAHAARKPGVKVQLGIRVANSEILDAVKSMSPEERGDILRQYVKRQSSAA